MKKTLIAVALIGAFFSAFLLQEKNTTAAGPNTVDIQILSPAGVKNYPGYETNVVVKITNRSNHELTKAMAYITMADLGKHWTVNLEDYSADKPIQLKTLLPGQSTKVSLPIRFVYTSQYKLYVTVSSDSDMLIDSSNAIPIEILGNSKIDPTFVTVISIVEPLLLLLILLFTLFRSKSLKA